MRPGSRREVVLCAVLVLIALGWIVTGLRTDSGELHEAPVVLVGPDVVTAPLVKQVNAVPGRPFTAGAVDDPAEAAELLESGDVVAAVHLDLSGTRDDLRVAAAHRPELARAIHVEVTRIEKTRGRTVALVPAEDRHEERSWTGITFVSALAGFLLVCVVSLVWGPLARTLRRLLARLTALAALAVGAGVWGWLLAAPAPAGERLLVASVLAATVIAAGALTFACEVIGRLPGLLFAAAVIVAGPVPLVVAGDRLLLAEPWATSSRWTIAGAAESLLWAVEAPTGIAQPVVTIVGSALLGLVVLVASRWLVRGLVEPEGHPVSVSGWRRTLGVVLVSATCLTVTATALTTALHAETVPRPLASLASTTQCVPSGPVEDVDDLNRITRLRAEPALQGGDVGVSATLADGRSIWMFGDTLRDKKLPGAGFVRNSMLLVEPDCLRVVLPESGGAIIPDRDDGVGYWPMSVTTLDKPGYALVVVAAQRVRTTSKDVFGFEALGPAIAQFVVPDGGVPQLIAVTDVGADDADTRRPMWGAAAAVSGEWLYLYGTAREPDPELGTGFSLHVARVEPDHVAEPDRWTYWDGARWGRRPGAASELIPAADGVSQTLSVFERSGRWYAFSKSGEFLGDDLVFWTSSSPTGPFRAQPPVGTLPSGVARGELRYMPLAHPDILEEPDSVIVSYSRNSTDFGAVLRNPLLYRPKFIRVDLPDR
ncbi:hypothetical protein [Nocardioides luteus]|uniref:hypothetical protein n=1 Tax=Nocardioides luteus TaxID=1844 RepID=UPI0018C938EF|nr:hypothetical protein [Nocardioides luteus]MBG6097120.1 hypothetical protein [Nocardioides luteus]